jgi:hypothetical protein
MYFNRRVLATVAVICNYGIAQAGSCSQAVVNAASDAGFLQFALLNCIPGTQAGAKNILQKTVLDPQSCIATFAAQSNVKLGSDQCSGAYLTFVTDLASYIATRPSPFDAEGDPATSGYQTCTYDSINEQILVSYVCWNRLSNFLIDFQQSAGYPMVTNACDGSFVRSQALLNPLQNVVRKTLTAVADGGTAPALYRTIDYRLGGQGRDGDNHIVVGKWAKDSSKDYKQNGVDLNLAMCYGAYQTIFDLLQGSRVISILVPQLGALFGDVNGDPSGWKSETIPLTVLQTACKSDITSAACAGSQLMSGLKSLFNNMSGYDIDFTGPLCSADTISKLDSPSLTPTPYQFFVMCGLMSSQYREICSTASVAQYVATLNSTVGTECNGCYNEMYSAIQDLVSDSTVTSS